MLDTMHIGFPFAAVLISTAFLLLVSIVQFIGLDPHFLNGAIYYGTLYGPFYLAYQATNHSSSMWSVSYLPFDSGLASDGSDRQLTVAWRGVCQETKRKLVGKGAVELPSKSAPGNSAPAAEGVFPAVAGVLERAQRKVFAALFAGRGECEARQGRDL